MVMVTAVYSGAADVPRTPLAGSPRRSQEEQQEAVVEQVIPLRSFLFCKETGTAPGLQDSSVDNTRFCERKKKHAVKFDGVSLGVVC